jgi:heat-inducible transcriptional repressor
MINREENKQLDERSTNVLKTLIREFVHAGKPVGSQLLSELYREKLSTATLRSVMADLEKAGYLSHPHTSAGRVPTLQGYRFYVESLLKLPSLRPSEEGEIKRQLEEESDPVDLMEKTSRLLSTYSNNIGIVLSPPISQVSMKHIEFVRLSEKRVVVLLVSTTGLVRQKLVILDRDFSQSELDQASRYLVENFAERSLAEIRSELVSRMSEERAQYDRLLRNAILLGTVTLDTEEDEQGEPLLYYGGTSRVLSRLQDPELDRVFHLFQALEEKEKLVKLITECLKEAQGDPSVTIGLEPHLPGMQDWTLITSRYTCEPGATGTLGVLGPCRMEYEKTISLVDYVARLFGDLMVHK